MIFGHLDGHVFLSDKKFAMLIGMGNIIVELCSADIEFRVCRYISWNKDM